MVIKFRYNAIFSYVAILYILGNYLFSYYGSYNIALIYQMFVLILTIYILGIKGYIKKIPNSILFWIFVNSIYILVNGLLNHNMDRLRFGIRVYVIFELFVIIGIYAYKYINIDFLFKIFIIYGVIDSVIGMYEFFTQRAVFSKTNESVAHLLNGSMIVRTQGLNGSYFSMAMMITFCALITFYMFIKKGYLIYLICEIIEIMGLFTTQSRGPMVAFFISFMILYFLLTNNEKKNILQERRIRILFGVIGICILVSIISSNFNFNNMTVNTIFIRIRQIFDWKSDTANVTRLNIISNAFSIFKSHLWFGMGIGSTGSEKSAIMVTESGILGQLVDLGIVGTVFNIMISVQVLIRTYYIRKSEYKPLYLLLLTIVIAVMVENIILQIYGNIETMIIYYTVLGFMLAIDREIKFNKSNNYI